MLATTVAGAARPLVAAATTYFVFNTFSIAIAIALTSRQPLLRVWNANFLWSAPSYFVGAGAAAVATWAVMTSGIWLALLAIAPLYLTYRTYKVYLGRIDDERRHVEEMADLHLATIEALALAIDAKDQTTQTHIRRVQVYATSLARALGMTDSEIKGVKTAALLHDIGKLAVPEHILSKPGPLTQEEFQKIRIHPQVGAEIISAVPFPYPVAPLILSHHERWDGRGYPQGLRGDDIPLGARILTVVDYFDALTSERPYHQAMTHEAALLLLQQEAGRALDPRVVDLFVEQLPEMTAKQRQLEGAPTRRLSLQPTSDWAARPRASSPSGSKGSTVFERHRAGAPRNLRALRDRADDGHQPRRGGHDGAHHFEAEPTWCRSQPARCSCSTSRTTCCAAGLRPARKPSDQHDGHPGRPRADRLGGPQPAAARQRTAERRLRGGAASASPPALQSALVARWCSTTGSSARSPCITREPDFYTDDHRRLLDRVSEQAAAVIHNSIVFEQTQEDSLTDPLTGLPNTRFMFLHLSRELARAERMKSEVALLVMDLDSFKEINDTLRPSRRRSRAARSGARAARRDPALRHLHPLRRRRVRRGAARVRRRRGRAEAAGTAAGGGALHFEARPGRRVPLASASAPRSSRATATATRRCWPPPTAACIATRPAASAEAPEVGRSDRHRRPDQRRAVARDRRTRLSDVDIQRAGFGVTVTALARPNRVSRYAPRP